MSVAPVVGEELDDISASEEKMGVLFSTVTLVLKLPVPELESVAIVVQVSSSPTAASAVVSCSWAVDPIMVPLLLAH